MEFASPPQPPPVQARSYRINSIDLLRGLVMIIMALDHTRDFFHVASITGDPLDLHTTTPLLYFTRWITHICAPTFVFLSGTSAYLQGFRKSKPELSRFLISRGLWLILMEIVIVNLGITFDITYSSITFQVIWAIGISMVILGLMVRLPFTAILIVGAVVVLGHNLLDYWEASHPPPYSVWYDLLHFQSEYPLTKRLALNIFYPFLPWAGLMMLGYCFGSIYRYHRDNGTRIVLYTGVGLLVFFVILRLANGYGNPFHWAVQRSSLYTFLSFMNVQKYPPSLLYMCATLGITLTFMAVVGNATNRLSRVILVYGRVPFFYYLLHFYLIHLISAVCYLARGHSVSEGEHGVPGVPFKFIVPGEGYGLGVVYLVWICVVVALYPVCKWYSNYKQTHKSRWLSYL